MVLPVQMSAVVVNAMGRRGRRRSQDHAPRLSPPDAHAPHMGRGSCRTDGDVVDLVGVATPGSRATAFTAQNSSPQAGIVLPAQMSAVVVNEMGRRGRRRSQDHAPRLSPPAAHSPHMGRGSCRTDGDVVDLWGWRPQDHAPRHSPPDPHSPNMGRGRRRTDGDVVDLVGLATPGSRRALPLHFVCCDVVPVNVLAQARA